MESCPTNSLGGQEFGFKHSRRQDRSQWGGAEKFHDRRAGKPHDWTPEETANWPHGCPDVDDATVLPYCVWASDL